MKNTPWWQMSLAIAAVTLGDRKKRRRFISGLLFFSLAYFCFGNWVIDSWLGRGLGRMLTYWGFMALMLVFVMLFTLYDALAVIGEERQKMGLSKPKVDEEISRE